MKEGIQVFCCVNGKFFAVFVRRVMMCVLLVLLLLAVSGSEVFCAPAKQTNDKTDEYDFVLVNNSGFTFRNIWMSHPGKPNWTEQDKLKLEHQVAQTGLQNTTNYFALKKNLA